MRAAPARAARVAMAFALLLVGASQLRGASGQTADSGAASAAPLTAPVLQPPTVLLCGSVPALEVLYARNPGGEIIGVLQALVDQLQVALCPTSYGYLAACDAYHAAVRGLWEYLGAELCGVCRYTLPEWSALCVPQPAWNATYVACVRTMTPAQALEFLLAQCVVTYDGDLGALVQAAAAEFMQFSSRARADVSSVLVANAQKAGLDVSAISSTLTVFPPVFPALAPVPTLGRQPAVRTAQPSPESAEDVPTNPSLFAGGAFSRPEYDAPRAPGPFPDLGDNADATSQYPDKLAAAAQAAPGGRALYLSRYAAHPSPLARFDAAAQCAVAAWDDDTCFPVVTPAVGVTYDAYGNRLATDRGQPVPAGTVDAAGVLPPYGMSVPDGTFTAPLVFTPDPVSS